MKTEIRTNGMIQINIDCCEAFTLLCKVLDMKFVLDEEKEFFVKKDAHNENSVWIRQEGKEELYDERGDLFISLRNVAVNLFPNLSFRGDDYIFS